MRNDRLTLPISCSICCQPITQGMVMANERGKAVHESCFVRKIAAQSAPRAESKFRLG